MFKQIISVVPHNSGELVTNAAKSVGASGGTIIMGKGTSKNGFVQLLGFGETSKDIIYILVQDDLCNKVLEKIKSVFSEKKSHFGVLFTLDVDSFVKSGKKEILKSGEKIMETEKTYEMINVIVNKGYAEDAMDVARKAGAGGGTIINARGTAKKGDATFFGVEIVPEKEMLMIIVPTEKKDDIIKAIYSLKCFEKAGSGIVFSNPASNFTLLGKTKEKL